MAAASLPLVVSSSTEAAPLVRSHLTYLPWLDGLRGIAISLVFIQHLQRIIYQNGGLFGGPRLPYGLLGVDIFFVLSGFLITTLLLEEHLNTNRLNLKNFYIRRALRLLPALIILLIFTIVFARLFLPSDEANWTLNLSIIALFYGTNWVRAFGGPGSDLLGHLWSLAVEEQFYLLWPLALSMLLRLRLQRRRLILLIFSLIVLVCLHRSLMVSPGVDPFRVYFGSDTRADSLLVGCLAAMLVSWRMITFNQTLLRSAIVLSLLIIGTFVFDLFGFASRTLYTSGFTVFALAVGLFILRVISSPNVFVRLLENRALVWIGKLSYSLYLWHFFTIWITLRVPVSNALRVALATLISVGVAACSFYLIERPFLKLKSRYATSPIPTKSA